MKKLREFERMKNAVEDRNLDASLEGRESEVTWQRFEGVMSKVLSFVRVCCKIVHSWKESWEKDRFRQALAGCGHKICISDSPRSINCHARWFYYWAGFSHQSRHTGFKHQISMQSTHTGSQHIVCSTMPRSCNEKNCASYSQHEFWCFVSWKKSMMFFLHQIKIYLLPSSNELQTKPSALWRNVWNATSPCLKNVIVEVLLNVLSFEILSVFSKSILAHPHTLQTRLQSCAAEK